MFKRQTYFPFLELPPEIRWLIYRYIVKSSHLYILMSPRLSTAYHTNFPHSLILTCSIIYQEIYPLYFTLNSFSIILDRHNEMLLYLLSPRFRSGLRMIRKLRISIVRWGKKTFFEDQFAPFLEDCILHGNLRYLEFLLRDNWVSGILNGNNGDLQSWRILKTLLKDPYLEKAYIWAGSRESLISSHQKKLINMNDVSWLLES